MTVVDKIPIGKYKCMRNSSGEQYDYVEIKLKKMRVFLKDGDIITLDMIEPYESEAVRKVTEYLRQIDILPNRGNDSSSYDEIAKYIVQIVHEAEDADE